MTTLRRLAIRCAALLVAASAGVRVAAPAIDAFVNHRGVAESARIHLDKPGGCNSHAEHCAVRGQSASPRGTPSRTVVRFLAPRAIHHTARAAALAPTRPFAASNHSRAPPVTLV